MRITLSMRLQLQTILLLVTFGSMFTSQLASAKTIAILPSEKIINIGSDVSYLVDDSENLSLQQFQSNEYQSKLQPTEMDTPSFGFTSDTYWFQIELVHNGGQKLSRSLVVSYPLLDEITVYLVRNQGHVTTFETGDVKPFSQRPELHRHFTFPIEFQPREALTLIVKTKTTSSMQIPMELWLPEKLHHDDKEALLAQGIYYGIMIIMVVYNFFIFLVVRSPGYLYYVLYVASVAGFQAALNGIGYQFLWPESPWLQDVLIAGFIPMIIATAAIFSMSLLQTKSRIPRFHLYLTVIACISTALLFFAPLIPYAIGIKLNIGLGFLGVIVLVTTGLASWKKGFEVAKYFSLAWFAFLCGAMLII